MKSNVMRLFCGSCLLVLALTAPVFAKENTSNEDKKKPAVKVTTDFKAQATSEDNTDLGDDNEGGSDNQLLELKSKLEADLSEQLSVLVEARGVKNYGDGGSIDTETGEATGQEDFLELRQYWVGYKDMFGAQGLEARLGRQRVREDYGFWWNRDLDAARVFYNTGDVKSFLGVGQNLAEYRTSDDSFNEDDEDILRVFGEVSVPWQEQNFVEGRFLYQDDHSGIERAGETVRADDFDRDDADLLWLGLRLKGLIGDEAENKDDVSGIKYRVDLAGVVGEGDNLLSSSGTTFRTVTGASKTDVRAWALDAGVDVPILSSGWSGHVGYAYGSGDDDSSDSDDHAFVQTGLDGNSSRLGGFSGTINNYGSVLRPDLSNLHIATLGLTVPLSEATDIAGYYRYYRLAESEGAIVSGVSGTLSGDSSDLGQGFDVILNTDVAKQFGFEKEAIKRINLRTTLGAFRAGEAYGDDADDTALRGQIDLGLRF